MGIQGMPGIGDSLGMCCVCGESFVGALLWGRCVQVVHIEAIADDLCVHTESDQRDCMERLKASVDGGWETLPEGPLREAFAKAAASQKEDEE